MTISGALQLEPRDPDRLGELGLGVVVLHRAVRAGIEARATRTGLAPRNAQGTDLVSHTVEELRLLLEPAGWTADWAGGQERTVSADGLTAVIVSTGAGAVGDLRGDARTAHPKGPLMRHAVTENLGFVQEEIPLGLFEPPAPGARRLCWVLLVKVEPGRALLELSVPTGMREGVVDSWAERIPLPPLPLGDPVEPGEPAADVDVPVDPRP
jgi:hypothetical protein